jgi:hypothetical protein
LLARIGIGAAIFAAFLIADLMKKGRQSQRPREYLFALVAVAAAMAYGVINDQITVTISPEYFTWGKGVRGEAGSAGLRWQAVLLGLKATWTVGLLIGVALLLANNPMKTRPQLPYGRLYRLLPAILATAAACGALGGALGYGGWLSFLAADVARDDSFAFLHPRRFFCAWGIHSGGYIGGLIATAGAVVSILRQRKKFGSASHS